MSDDYIEPFYHEKLIDEMVQMIRDNLIILYNHDKDSLISVKKYCKDKLDEEYKPLHYEELVYLVDESLADLINTPFFYDFRPLE